MELNIFLEVCTQVVAVQSVEDLEITMRQNIEYLLLMVAWQKWRKSFCLRKCNNKKLVKIEIHYKMVVPAGIWTQNICLQLVLTNLCKGHLDQSIFIRIEWDDWKCNDCKISDLTPWAEEVSPGIFNKEVHYLAGW